MTFNDFLHKLKDAAPDAVCNFERSAERLERFTKLPPRVSLPPTPREVAGQVANSSELIATVNELNSADVLIIQINTVGQAENQHWLNQRAGRITASNFHCVMTRMKTYSTDPSTDMTKLLKRLCGYTDCVGLQENVAIKYGRNMEDEAIEAYSRQHKKDCGNAKIERCGIFILQNAAYLGASPDGLVSCGKCGLGVIEIKCPLTASHEKPCSKNVSCLTSTVSGDCLNTAHMYYTQIQGQMAISGRHWCDFFVYSRHGFYLERIKFNPGFWSNCFKSLIDFFTKFMAQELITQTLLNKQQEALAAMEDISFLFDQSSHSDIEGHTAVPTSSSQAVTSTEIHARHTFPKISKLSNLHV